MIWWNSTREGVKIPLWKEQLLLLKKELLILKNLRMYCNLLYPKNLPQRKILSLIIPLIMNKQRYLKKIKPLLLPGMLPWMMIMTMMKMIMNIPEKVVCPVLGPI